MELKLGMGKKRGKIRVVIGKILGDVSLMRSLDE